MLKLMCVIKDTRIIQTCEHCTCIVYIMSTCASHMSLNRALIVLMTGFMLKTKMFPDFILTTSIHVQYRCLLVLLPYVYIVCLYITDFQYCL